MLKNCIIEEEKRGECMLCESLRIYTAYTRCITDFIILYYTTMMRLHSLQERR